jgi:hypothetical protein
MPPNSPATTPSLPNSPVQAVSLEHSNVAKQKIELIQEVINVFPDDATRLKMIGAIVNRAGTQQDLVAFRLLLFNLLV